MDIRRFFVNEEDIKGGELTLAGEEFFHAAKVIRLKPGFLFVASAGSGVDYNCKVKEIRGGFLTAEILSEEPNLTEAGIKVTLFQAVLKNNKLDEVVQKAAELGAISVIPFFSEYTKDAALENCNIVRLKKIAKEASKQCGRSRVIEVAEPIKFDALMERAAGFDKVFFFYENEEGGALKDNIDRKDKNIAVIIGGEGGFSPAEAEILKNKGTAAVGLGKRILRADTAAVSALTLIFYLMGEMQ